MKTERLKKIFFEGDMTKVVALPAFALCFVLLLFAHAIWLTIIFFVAFKFVFGFAVSAGKCFLLSLLYFLVPKKG